ncbi:hypothetical protein PL75_02720 [Neisseria arctica]|uniref:N-acetyltransferase domain-containing protein n=1 Tax=Neisseria arctica TaxID=1470200 RepID=A0A0J0YTR0_9NEIS|nr:GNAT family N-acetyltransferase [Neisseria arctica]KLT73496.1 hypothetical protein PL75_02720 [Neisseria arctica]UOO86164.1 GNAT family N-acetyltransferase [Neisseria arctica]
MQTVLRCFYELGIHELYAILALRSRVFVVEQECPYQDPDGEKDFQALHLLIQDGQQLAAYARILPPSQGIPAIGRVVTAPEYRGKGMARNLMQQAIAVCRNRWPQTAIAIQAQSYLIDFYKSLGFTPVSIEYLEDGIPHVDMQLKAV